MNSRKYYEKHFNVKVPKDFDVHHIDCNRNNNDITNLVALPRVLHRRYHAAKYNFHITITEKHSFITSDNCNIALSFELDIVEEMHKTLRGCFPYIFYRDILLGILPMHALTIEKPY